MDRVEAIRTCRIETGVEKLASYRFIKFPEQPQTLNYFIQRSANQTFDPAAILSGGSSYTRSEPGVGWRLSELIHQTQAQSFKAANEMQQISMAIYEATQDMIDLVAVDFDNFVRNYVKRTRSSDHGDSSG